MKAIFIAVVISVIMSCTVVRYADDIDTFDFIGYFNSQWEGK